MQRFHLSPKVLKTSVVAMLVGGLLYAGSEPAHSGVSSTITLAGAAAGILALDGSGNGAADCTQSGGAGAGASWTTTPTDQGSANGTFNFGTLSSGDGSVLTAQLGLRVRANSKCHVNASCNQATISIPAAPANYTYKGTQITSNALLASTIGIANTVAAISGGVKGDVTAYSSAGSVFTGANTLANLTNAAAPLTGSTQFCSFTKAPSTGGSASSGNNYVEVYPLFTTETGLSWGVDDGTAPAPFSVNVIFGLFAN